MTHVNQKYMSIAPIHFATNNLEDSRRYLRSGLLFISLSSLIWLVSPLSLITYGILSILICLILLTQTRRKSAFKNLLFAYTFYSLIAVLLFYAFRYFLPEWDGLSGPLGVGLDDTFYYTQATGNVDATRGEAKKAMIQDPHHFSLVLQNFAYFVSLYKPPHLLDLLLLNASILSFLPLLCVLCVRKCLSGWSEILDGKRALKIAYWLPIVHPSLWSHGLVLIRDGWTAVLFMASILSFLHVAFVRYVLLAVSLAYFRLASGITLVLCSVPLLWPTTKRKFGKYVVLYIICFAMFSVSVFVYAWFSGYIEQKGISFLRNEYVETFLARAADRKQSISILYVI